MKPGDWVTSHKGELALGGLGIAVTLYLYSRSQSSTSTASPASAAGEPYVASYILARAPSAGSWSVPSGIRQRGSGFLVPGAKGDLETSPGGTQYEEITSKSELSSLQQEGDQLYFQPAPGVFDRVTKKIKLRGGTPLFTRVG